MEQIKNEQLTVEISSLGAELQSIKRILSCRSGKVFKEKGSCIHRKNTVRSNAAERTRT